MNQKSSKILGIVLLVMVCLALGFYGWYSYFGPGKNSTTKSGDQSVTTNNSAANTTGDAIVPDSSKPSTNATKLTFSQADFNFTFNYPSSWTITATNTKTQPTDKVSQETVKIFTENGTEFRLNNPAVSTTYEGFNLSNPKDITAGNIIFKRNYGLNSSKQTFYVANYDDPNNIDALSVSFYGIGTMDDKIITAADELLSSFKFN